MDIIYDVNCGRWSGFTRGHLRPIVAEAMSPTGVAVSLLEGLMEQDAEQYCLHEAISAKADMASGEYAFEGDMG